MTSLKPYLIRSLYDWIIDNNLTPYLLVDATHTEAQLPEDYVNNGQIILNIRPTAIQDLSLGNTAIEFNARFDGQSMHVIAPTSAVMAVYAKENGKGMVFDQEDENMTPPPEDKPPLRPQLSVVK